MKMKMNHTLTVLVGAGLLGLMSSTVTAPSTNGPFDTAVKQTPTIVLAQEDAQEQRHEAQRYEEQMRQDQHRHSDQQTAMGQHGYQSTRRHHKHHIHSLEVNRNNVHDQH